MQPHPLYRSLSKEFWANVRLLSQILGYTDRRTGRIRVYTPQEMVNGYLKNNLDSTHLVTGSTPTSLGEQVLAYIETRAELINVFVHQHLMSASQAGDLFTAVQAKLQSRRVFPLNKQKGDMRQVAYLTALVTMLIEYHLDGLPCDYAPRVLTTVTHQGQPLRTLSRQVDGCFPSPINPIALWEIKEYYYTTSFGSRIADGVYETLLDGLELEELNQTANIHIQHLLIVDGYETWWLKGKSYLCRLIDLLHMGYADEVLFGSEVIARLPVIVQDWKAQYDQRLSQS